MKNLLVLLCLTLAAVAAPPNTDEIIAAYRQAHANKNLEGLMALVEFSPHTPHEIYDLKKAIFRTQLSFVVTGIKVAPLTEEDMKTLARLHEVYDSTLEPKAKLEVLFDESMQAGPAKSGSSVSFLGIKDGAYRILTAKKKALNRVPATD